MKRDYKKFPKTDNGEVLWELRCSGDALKDPREIDFSAIFPSKAAASQFAAALGRKHRVELERLEKDEQVDGFPWHVLVYLHEVPKHARINAFEASLKKQATPLGGRLWGWSATFIPSTDPSVVAELWWVYVARDPDDGLLGSIRINLGLKDQAPMRAVPILLTSGASYESGRKRAEMKLPGPKELTFLERLREKRVALVMSRTTAVHVGSYTHANTQEDFFYVADAKGLEAALKKLHQKQCPGRRFLFATHKDPGWREYLNFLYPNEATMKHYRTELEELGVL